VSTVVTPAAGPLSGPETGLELWVGRPGGSRLVGDLVSGAPALAPFYAGHFRDSSAFRRKADAVHARLPSGHRERLADAFVPTSESAADKLKRVLSGSGLAVTTGQQTGLFGGPLYTLYKILSATRLAAALEDLFGETVLPVFWMASDDHDWAEVNHTVVVDRSDDVRRLALDDPADAPPVPMSDRLLTSEITAAVADLEAVLGDGSADRVLRLVRNAYRPGVTMAAAFGTLLRGILDGLDVVLIDSAHPALKAASASIIARELDNVESHAALLRRQTDRLIEAGYHEQVTVAADAANVFLHEAEGRDRLAIEPGGWHLRRSRRSMSRQQIEALLVAEPSRFSPNVFLRPVVESALIPTVAYVGGPGEVSYFAQIGCLFEAHGVEPPVVVPRQGVTVVEPRIRHVLDRFSLQPADLARPLHEITTDFVHGELPETVTQPLERLREALEREFGALAVAAAGIDPTLHDWVMSRRNRALSDVARSERKVTSHLKKRRSDQIRQLRRASINLHPNGAPQERVLNALPLLARYGPALLRDIAACMRVDLDARVPGWDGVDCG
jgi:bacillithiol biosynthesis cysteine-adding enzyme BshC